MKQNIIQGTHLILSALQSAGLARQPARHALKIIKCAWRFALMREHELELPGITVRFVWCARHRARRLRWRAGALKQFGELAPTIDRLTQRVRASFRGNLVFRQDSDGVWYPVRRRIDRNRQRPWRSTDPPPPDIPVVVPLPPATNHANPLFGALEQQGLPATDRRFSDCNSQPGSGRFGRSDGIIGSRTWMFRR